MKCGCGLGAGAAGAGAGAAGTEAAGGGAGACAKLIGEKKAEAAQIERARVGTLRKGMEITGCRRRIKQRPPKLRQDVARNGELDRSNAPKVDIGCPTAASYLPYTGDRTSGRLYPSNGDNLFPTAPSVCPSGAFAYRPGDFHGTEARHICSNLLTTEGRLACYYPPHNQGPL